MAQYERHFTGSFQRLLVYLEHEVLNGSVTVSREGGTEMTCGDVRCAVMVYERYRYLGKNRLTLTVTLFGRDDNILLTAITSGGSQALFFKINTWGEEAFLNKFISQVEAYHP
jgi:hypothetical protein